jgi:hypothetical protein
MTFPDAGTPPSSMGAYVEDMLNELAEIADRLNDLALAAAIRKASLAAANGNAKAWNKSRSPPAREDAD